MLLVELAIIAPAVPLVVASPTTKEVALLPYLIATEPLPEPPKEAMLKAGKFCMVKSLKPEP